ncbi:unnamed protein product, partial [Strongylus vulgaris]
MGNFQISSATTTLTTGITSTGSPTTTTSTAVTSFATKKLHALISSTQKQGNLIAQAWHTFVVKGNTTKLCMCNAQEHVGVAIQME